MNVFAKFDEIPSMIVQDIKETKRYGHTDGRSFVQSDGRTDNVYINGPGHMTKMSIIPLYGKFLKIFFSMTIHYDGHLGHVTWTIYINFLSPFQRRLQMRFGIGWPSAFREDV